MTYITFLSDQAIQKFTLKTKSIKTMRNISKSRAQKNSFLFEFNWVGINDENNDNLLISIQNSAIKHPITNFNLDDFALGDITKERNMPDSESSLITIGKKGENDTSSRICINVIKP